MLAALLVATVTPQRDVIGVKDLDVKEAYMPGQREIVLGPLPYRETVMSVIHSKDYPGTFDGKGLAPPVWDEYPLGHVRWSVAEGSLFEKPCRVLRLQGMTQSQVPMKRLQKVVGVQNDAVTVWYLSFDGRILRQYEQRSGYGGQKVANCTYGEDEIQVQVEEGGKRRITTVYPAVDMEKLHLQFRPMIVGDRVVMEEKEYFTYDPFGGGFQKRTAKIGGLFAGQWLQRPFKGRHVDITTPRHTVKAYISDEGDLVKVDLPKDDFFILQSLPPGKEKKG
ncbi:MAG: hypothetical protein ACO1SV_08865 [Fimbriimonas sp.]